MNDILDLELSKLIFVKAKTAQKKDNTEKESYIALTKDNKKKYIELNGITIPFGVENYQNKNIINIEINTKKNNKFHNTYSILSSFENELKTLRDNKICSNELKNSLQDKEYYPNMRESKCGQIIRTQLFGQPIITTQFIGQKMSAPISNIKKSIANVKLELGGLWITESNYGISWYIKEIEIQYNYE